MNFKSNHSDPRGFEYRIQQDDVAGFYLLVVEGAKCTKDHLQDSFELAVEQALEDYGVPVSSWVKDES